MAIRRPGFARISRSSARRKPPARIPEIRPARRSPQRENCHRRAPQADAPETGLVEAWPPSDVFRAPVDAIAIGTGATCLGVALCDESGRPTGLFEIGQNAVFYAEFVLNEDIEVPIAGVEIINERHLVVHGKNSMQYQVAAPGGVRRGGRVRVRHRIRLDIAEGRYSFGLGLSTMSVSDYSALEGTLPFHGLCDLDGNSEISVISPVPHLSDGLGLSPVGSGHA